MAPHHHLDLVFLLLLLLLFYGQNVYIYIFFFGYNFFLSYMQHYETLKESGEQLKMYLESKAVMVSKITIRLTDLH